MTTTEVTATGMEPNSASAAAGVANTRLADEDATYWLLHEGLGWSVVLQLVWQIPGIVAKSTVDTFAESLSYGRLHRRLVAPRVRGARPRWVIASGVPDVVADSDAIAADEVDAWAVREMSHADLDAAEGRCWRVRMVRTVAGDTAVSLCALHLVTDGRGLVDAAATALAGLDRSGSGRPSVSLVDAGSVLGEKGSRRSDIIDALGQVGAAAAGVVRAARTTLVGSSDASVADSRQPRAPMAQRAPRATPVWATVTVPAEVWDRVAQSRGGTANTLFVAVIAGLLRTSGYAPHGVPVKVGVPVDRRRGADDDRANATAGVSVILTDDPVPGGDLTPLRAACKQAFVRLAEGRRPAAIHLQPLIWLLPTDWVVAAATAGSGMPDAVTSNLGEVADGVMSFGPQRAQRCAFRGIADGVDPAGPHRFGDGVQSWLLRTSTDVTFSVVGFDEECFSSDDRLRRLLADELSAWDLTAEIW